MGAATFADFCAAWPKAAGDNQRLARSAWDRLGEEGRQAAVDGVATYLAALREVGRSAAPAGATYLSRRLWETER